MALSDAERYRQAMLTIRGQVRESVNKLYGLAREQNLSPEQIRDAFMELMPDLTRRHGEEAAAFAADWYEELRSRHGSAGYYRTEMAPLTEGWEVMVDTTVDRLSRHLWTGEPEDLVPGLVDTIDKLVGEAAHRTVAHNAANDPDRPRYRVTLSPSACEFCREVAREVEALRAGDQMTRWFHGGCHCTVEPIWR